jgi:regulatory protein
MSLSIGSLAAWFALGLWLGPRPLLFSLGGSDLAKITALQFQQRRRDRVSVFLDGEYAFSLQGILAAELHRGQELHDQDVAVLRQRDAVEVAYESALGYLSYRPRSTHEMRDYLQKKGLESDGCDEVLVRLQRVGLVSDDDFAQFWVGNREGAHPLGRRAMRAELRQKGVAKEVIESAVAAIDEETSALKAASRVAVRLARLGEETFRRRLLGFLQRRGFGYEVAKSVTRQLWQEVGVQQDTNPEQRAMPDDS